MFKRLNYLYKAEKITAAQLDIAVSKGWITAEQKTEIVAV